MTIEPEHHIPESEFHANVVAWCMDYFGDQQVFSKAYQGITRRYPDILIDGPMTDFACELENDAAAGIKGIGQASLYAATAGHRYVPIVIVPDDHVAEPEFSHVNEHTPVHIREFPNDFPGAAEYS